MALLLGLFLTIALYGAFPLLYSLLHKGSIRKTHFRNLCICYGVSVYLVLFLFAEFYSGEPGTFFPAALWTTLWYKACCGILSASGRLNAPSDPAPPAPPVVDISDIPCEVVEEYHSDYKVPSSAPSPANAAFTIQLPKPHPAPEAPAKPRKSAAPKKHSNKLLVFVISIAAFLVVAIGVALCGSSPSSSQPDSSQLDVSQPSGGTLTPRIVSIANGEIVKHPYKAALAPLTVSTRGDDSYYIYLKQISSGASMSFFVRGGKSAEVEVPLGEYEIYYAVGKYWYGSQYLFGDDTAYYKCDDTFLFYEDGDYYQGWTLELYAQPNGNLDTDHISAVDFPG